MICRIYTDPLLIPKGMNPVIMLYPFFDAPAVSEDDPDKGRFDDYRERGKELFQLTSKEVCDFFELPFDFTFDLKHQNIIRAFIQDAQLIGKKVLLFYNADDDRPIDLENVIVFRTSFYLSNKRNYEFAFPGWSVDFLKTYRNNQLTASIYNAEPVIGYCGYVDSIKPGFFRWIKDSLGKKPPTPWAKLRGRAVRSVLKTSGVKPNILIRDGFWADGIEDKKRARQEYADNMLASDYALCCRGGGNFSYRLYEVMSLGRIPVFIDTDCVLPFADDINWDEFMVRIPVQQVDQIGAKLLAFHRKLSADDFMKLQHSIRSVYTDYISPRGFFYNLAVKLSNHE